MKTKWILLWVSVVALVAFNGCGLRRNMAAESDLDAKLKKMQVPAVIAVTPGLEFKALQLNGAEAKRCSIPERGKKPEFEICPAFKDGARIIDQQTITIIKSEGSICYTYYDRNNHAHVICIP